MKKERKHEGVGVSFVSNTIEHNTYMFHLLKVFKKIFTQEGDPDYIEPTSYSLDEDIGDYSGDNNDEPYGEGMPIEVSI